MKSPPIIADVRTRLGPASESAATLYVEVPLSGDQPLGPAWRLTGVLRGPRSRYARTLPAVYPLHDLGREPTWLAEARVTEPCYWSPESPMLYDLAVELRNGDAVVARVEQTTGLVRRAWRDDAFWLDGRRRTLRAWRPAADAGGSPAQLREHDLALWWDAPASPSDELLADASEHGVLVAGEVEGGCWPCVLPVSAGDAVLVEHTAAGAAFYPATGRATVAWRRDATATDAASARRACERLQADCAPHTDLAGYVVF